ncbi:MAG: flavin reductase [Candidatus Hodarchaeales archaeon]
MEKLIFATISNSGSTDSDIHLFASSIRKFAGSLSNSPIWVFVPESQHEIKKEMGKQLKSINVDIFKFTINQDVFKFPFTGDVLAAATAESLAKDKTEFLAWVGSDTLILNEPKDLLLESDINLGYRPVHHTLIGSIFEEPIDPFWKLIYQKCNVPDENIFPMKTHVDGNTLRPYFNAGFLIVRPKKGLLKKWWDNFKELYPDLCFKEYYKKNEQYIIFIYQAVLTGVILSTLDKQELKELPFNYNYPLHLYSESSKEFKPQNINDLITARHCSININDPQSLDKFPIHDPLKSWFMNQQHTAFQKNNPTGSKKEVTEKFKFGKIPLIYPIPIILAGALVNGKPNFETLGDVAIMGINPALVCISSGKDHYTNLGILEHGTFSINFPQTDLLAKTDYCGTVSGHNVDKSQLFEEVFYGELETTPMIQECPVNIECKVIKEFSIQHRQIFIGEVVQVYVNEEYVIEKDGKYGIAEMTKLDPIIYALDNRYYKIGEPIGIGYQESKKLQKK